MICCKYCGRRTRRFFDAFCSDECRNRLKQNPLEFEYRLRERVTLALDEVLIRTIAALLAAIGAFWGLLLFVLFHSEGDPLRVMIFALIAGPGYLVTAGYFWRAAARPAYQWRTAIWIASILVQGMWLLISLCDGRPSAAMLWWLAACAASVVALRIESIDQPTINGERCTHIERPRTATPTQ